MIKEKKIDDVPQSKAVMSVPESKKDDLLQQQKELQGKLDAIETTEKEQTFLEDAPEKMEWLEEQIMKNRDYIIKLKSIMDQYKEMLKTILSNDK